MYRPQGKGRRGLTSIGSLLGQQSPPGAPPEDLFWSCSLCGLVEPLFLPSGRWIKRSCQCQRQARARKEEEQGREAWRREQAYRCYGGWLGEKWVDSQIIREMKGKTFESFDPLRQPLAYEKAYSFAERPVGNLLFYGGLGVGKTHLEAAICNYLREVGAFFPGGKRQPVTSLFVSAPQFFVAYEETRRATDKTAHIKLVQQVTGTPVLILDDVDKSQPTEKRHEVYWFLLDERYKARRPTILSTNKQEELASYIGEAALSRLSRGLVAVKMIGADYRREEDP